MTIDEAAQSLGVTKTTIRRRIKRGEFRAIKKMGPYGDQYFIPADEIKTVREVTDVMPVTRQLNLLTLSDAVEQAIVSANEPFKREILERMDDLQSQITALTKHAAEEELNYVSLVEKEIAALRNDVNSIKQLELDYQAQSKRLSEAIVRQCEQREPSRWQRFKAFIRGSGQDEW